MVKIAKLFRDLLYRVTGKIAISQMKHIAATGIGSELCLEKGFLPVPVHFYQPVPDIKELQKRKVWDKVSKLSGIKIDDDQILNNLQTLSKWADECKWELEPGDDKSQFHLNNGCFSYGCASALHSMIREHRPKRIIEVGSGHSSKIIRDAIKLNERDGHACERYIHHRPLFYCGLGDLPKVRRGGQTAGRAYGRGVLCVSP